MKKIYLFSLCCCLNLASLMGQSIIGNIPFDNMDPNDVSGQGTSVVVNGTPEYGCGVVGGAILLDGDDFILVNGRANNPFAGDGNFTLSFYFKPTDFSNDQDIISKRQACTNQKAFAIRYIPSSSSIEVILAENSTKETIFLVPLPVETCWYHIAIVKNVRTTIVYLNGEEAARKNSVARIDLGNPESITIANGPCRGITDRRFQGYLDELQIFDGPLDREEIRALYTKSDAILNRDTLLFLGGTVPLRIGNTCTQTTRWNPGIGIDDPTAANATYTPYAEGTFKIYATFDDGACVASDTFKVVVIDAETLDCGEIFLPNAFTPNGDGINDKFGVDNPFAIEKMNTLEVIDRLGNTVFSTTDVFAKWDGSYKSQIVSPGVYIYRITFECKGEALGVTGSFTLLK